ncbi:MAG: ATP-dependent RecD-like DNA helicase, partial [Candidatus Cryptobacteroides sp.]
MGRADFLYSGFLSHLKYEPTPCQERMLRTAAGFICSDDSDILVVNGYAGTGKTTAMSAVINTMKEFNIPCVLLAPTGRAAKVLSGYSGSPAFTIHKHIYRQKAVGGDGFGEFTLSPNKMKNTLFVVDEVSLIGIDSERGQGAAQFGTGNLLEDLVSFVRRGVECKLVLMGDSAQLPPVGLDASPALSKDYMSMVGGAVFTSLSTVVRQQKESGILANATRIRRLIEGS